MLNNICQNLQAKLSANPSFILSSDVAPCRADELLFGAGAFIIIVVAMGLVARMLERSNA